MKRKPKHLSIQRAVTILTLALALRRRRRTLKRGLRILKRGVFVVSVAVALVVAVVWNKHKRGQVEEVSSGSRPIEGVGTAVAP
jgi:hypothetical protein